MITSSSTDVLEQCVDSGLDNVTEQDINDNAGKVAIQPVCKYVVKYPG